MSPTKVLLAVALGAGMSMTTASPAVAATSTTACDAMLVDLGSMQASLDELERAVAEGTTRQKALVGEAQVLATAIATEQRAGATEAELASLLAERKRVVTELDRLARHVFTLEGQLHALVLEVDGAERSYIACVESNLE